MLKTYQQFKNDWLGKKYAEDTKIGYQCVSLIKLYVKEVYGLELGSFSGSAINAWKSGSPFNSKWTRIYNTSSFIPISGDIAFFNITPSNKYGHVAIIDNANIKQVEVLEQNGGMGKGKGETTDAIRLHTYNYLSPKFLGCFRLKK